jgi:hypothetical protein
MGTISTETGEFSPIATVATGEVTPYSAAIDSVGHRLFFNSLAGEIGQAPLYTVNTATGAVSVTSAPSALIQFDGSSGTL